MLLLIADSALYPTEAGTRVVGDDTPPLPLGLPTWIPKEPYQYCKHLDYGESHVLCARRYAQSAPGVRSS